MFFLKLGWMATLALRQCESEWLFVGPVAWILLQLETAGTHSCKPEGMRGIDGKQQDWWKSDWIHWLQVYFISVCANTSGESIIRTSRKDSNFGVMLEWRHVRLWCLLQTERLRWLPVHLWDLDYPIEEWRPAPQSDHRPSLQDSQFVEHHCAPQGSENHTTPRTPI